MRKIELEISSPRVLWNLLYGQCKSYHFFLREPGKEDIDITMTIEEGSRLPIQEAAIINAYRSILEGLYETQ